MFSLVLTRHPSRAKIFDFPSAIPSNLLSNISPNTLCIRLPAGPLTEERAVFTLTAAQKRCEVDYENCVHETTVFKPNELAFVERPALAVKTKSSKITDETTYHKLMPVAE